MRAISNFSIFPYMLLFGILSIILHILSISSYLCIAVIFWLLPSMVAIVVDTKARGHLAMIVCMFNLCGLILQLTDVFLYYSSNDIIIAELMFNSCMWVYVYSYAALGWIVYRVVPIISSSILMHKIKNNMLAIESEFTRLQNEWNIK